MKTTNKTTNQTKKARAEALLLELSSAYQEDAITTTAENLKDYKNAQEFADDCCYQYRDNLKAAGYKGEAIYKGFRSFGDETELNAIALEYFAIMTEKEQRPTNAEPRNKIIIFEGIGSNKIKYELYNFSKVDHYQDKNTGKAYLRVLCDSRFYYFLAVQSVISKIEIFNK